MKYRDTAMTRQECEDKCLDTIEEVTKAQAEMTWHIASTYGFEIGLEQGESNKEKAKERGLEAGKVLGRKEVMEWMKSKMELTRCDPDTMAYFNDYVWMDYKEWQTKLKEWRLDK